MKWVVITFVPQAWVNDWAVNVDVEPEANTKFQIEAYHLFSRKPDSFSADDLRNHPLVPEWWKKWEGPFEIRWNPDDVPDHCRFPASLVTQDDVDNAFRFALNELKAMADGSFDSSDRTRCAERLADLAKHLEQGGVLPDVKKILKEAVTLPVQE